MKRAKPDCLAFATWAAAQLIFDDCKQHRARGLFHAWKDFADERGVEAGESKVFSNWLRKLGCPVVRYGARTKYHLGVRLVMPEPSDGPPDNPAYKPASAALRDAHRSFEQRMIWERYG